MPWPLLSSSNELKVFAETQAHSDSQEQVHQLKKRVSYRSQTPASASVLGTALSPSLCAAEWKDLPRAVRNPPCFV